MKKILIIIIGLILILLIFTFGVKKYSQVCFEENCFNVELAETAQKRVLGLMFRENLKENEGMLFIFEKEEIHPFWMKNTKIPLDIIWINNLNEIVYINKNTQPCIDYCPTINPNKNAKYVLEINAGISDKIGLKEGDKFKW